MAISINTFKNFIIISITEFIGFFANFITFFLLSRPDLYPPDEFALYSFSFTFISFFTIIINFGLGATLVRYLSAQKDQERRNIQELISEGFKLIFLFSTVVSLLVFIISTFIEYIYQIPNLGITLSYASIYLFFSNIIFYFESTFVGIWLFKYYSISKIIFNSLKLILILMNLIFNLSIVLIIAFYALISFFHFLLFLF